MTIAAAGCLGVGGLVLAQQGQQAPLARPAETPAPPPNVSTDPLLRGFEFRAIGPAVMMGRVDDIAGSEKDPMIVYVGFATGGLWKSTDGGNHWKSQFDNMANESIGAIGIAPSNPNVVYVGTGEANNRQSSSIGDGVWGTTDGGKTWKHLGLEDTQSIGRVVVDPTNPNIVYVAAMGHLFGANPERGLYKTIDGGKTWKKVEVHRSRYRASPTWPSIPSNPKIVYAASLRGGAPGGATTAAARAPRCGRPPTAATPGPSSMDRAGRNRRTASTAASRFRSSRRSRPRFTRRWKPAPAAAPAAARARTAVRLAADAAAFGAATESAAETATPGDRRRAARQAARRRDAAAVADAADAADLRRLPTPTPAASSAPTTAARPGRS